MPNFQIPDKIKVDRESYSDSYGMFTIEPLERGFGTTVGSALRRIMLSAIPGCAITAVRFDSVLHEFSTIEGVLEDVSTIILNLKQVKLDLLDSKPAKVTLKLQGPKEIKAKDLNAENPNIKIMNPNFHIMNIQEEKTIDLMIWFGRGRGYSPAEKNRTPDAPVDTIPVDSIFSPILKVNFKVEKLQSGIKEDLEKLIFEIFTDHSMSPDNALSYAADMMLNHIKPFSELKTKNIIEPEEQVDEEVLRIRKQLLRSIDELELSVRSYNCLQAADIRTIMDLVVKEEQEMLRYKNFGRKSLNELVAKLDDLGLRFGMDITPYTKDMK
ncbi:MAG: DNA-directed RNA polymerase subunit alpha [Candidatus Neomarinimicrobiota bacterium]|jgi:DNA-directed RNA polymerase subunit alpha|nr:DNA-directed RNA polymerase subunit alpha [Candidatus Neomarinimicrobiota bacterium]MDD3966691.1 DNA-directed RNA polymerase subunit alpha [Candidatus Neomarinimicrobiota bacterium]MDX9780646.1 DNA-directed RNA polymerase subunit alpha [bacterium]